MCPLNSSLPLSYKLMSYESNGLNEQRAERIMTDSGEPRPTSNEVIYAEVSLCKLSALARMIRTVIAIPGTKAWG
jgi:hypothetical protein